MSIRMRLMIICLIVALLPAVPLSFLVRGLLERSFSVGLSETVSEALESGIEVSRLHHENIRTEFEEDTSRLIASIGSFPAGTPVISKWLSGSSMIHGVVLVPKETSIPGAIATWGGAPDTAGNTGSRSWKNENISGNDIGFYETEDMAVLASRWKGPGDEDLILFHLTSPEFISASRNIIEGNQTFARLVLASGRLGSSFFYPFIVIYGVAFAVSLLLAFLLAERLAGPLRRLEKAAAAVAAGDWTVRLREKTGGETGRLVERFNEMVGRLESQRRRLADMEKISSWREMARHLAHEIKNPILPIRLTVQEMKDQYKGSDQQYGEFLEDSTRLVEGELNSLQSLVKEFSSFARLPGLSLKEGSLEEVAKDVAALYPGSIASIEASPGLPSVHFDHDQIRRVLINLFDNALSVLEDDQAPAITIALKMDDGSVQLTFSDNGPGIPEENISRIFDPYFTTRDEGTGLGLAVVKSIILQHGGSIEAQSPPGEGAVFRISIPVSREKSN